MITVRYTDGQAVTYNTAIFLEKDLYCWRLRTKKDGDLVAVIQLNAGVTVEFARPCHVENPLAERTGEQALEYVADHIEQLTALSSRAARAAEKLKRELRRFNARNWSWRKEDA